MKHSGLQKQVLKLFRDFLRTIRTKDDPVKRDEMRSIVCSEFRKNAKEVAVRDYNKIEYLLRRGSRQLDATKASEFGRISKIQIGGS
jgi:succinate dehydrogenase assembly factor 1